MPSHKTHTKKQHGKLLHHPVGNLGVQYIFDILGPIVSQGNVYKYVHIAVQNMSRLVIVKVVDSMTEK